VVAPAHEFTSAVVQELTAQLHAPLTTVAAAALASGASGQVVVVTPDALDDHEASRQLAVSGPAYSLVIPVEGEAAPPPWCTPINTVGRTPQAVAAEIMNDAANKHAVELDPIRSSRSGVSSTAMYVIIALAGALLLFGCAALVIGLPFGTRAEERVIFEERGVAFEEAPAIEAAPLGAPIPPPAEAPTADEYQPIAIANETGAAVDERIQDEYGVRVVPGSATFVGTAIAREVERDVFTWRERSSDGDLQCTGIFGLSGGSASCGEAAPDEPSTGWGTSSIDGRPQGVEASVSGLPDEVRWVVFTTDTGWRVVADAADGFATITLPEWEGIPSEATAYDSELNELWTGAIQL
jgi:hypothetical protein